jgi:hypothetical protein
MQDTKIDFAKLLGFSAVAEAVNTVDFKDQALDARLGAKVGTEAWACEIAKRPGLDFQNATFAARLGAKVGLEVR